MRPTKCPDIPVSLERNTEVFRQHFLGASSTLLIWTGGSTPLLCLEGVPDLPVAPQDEAGLTTTFQTWPRGWFHVPKDPDFPVPAPRAEFNMMWGNVGLWRPLNLRPDQINIRAYRSFMLIGRLRDGVEPAVIGSQLAPLAVTQEKEFPQDYPNLRYNALTLN